METEKTQTENAQDERAIESLNKLNMYLNNQDLNNQDLNNQDLDNQDPNSNAKNIEKLSKLAKQLREMYGDQEDNQEDNIKDSQNPSPSNGKVLTKSLKGFNKQKEPASEQKPDDAKEIAASFINCFILCMVTAIMGTGWFIYIINHI